MVSLLISILVALLFVALIYWVLTLLPIPQQIRIIVVVLLALIVLLYFLSGHSIKLGWANAACLYIG